MSPKIVDRNAQRRILAGAALRVFTTRGFEKTTVNDVARAAGIGKGSVYEYFRSKEELIAAAVDFWIDAVEERLGQQLAIISDPAEKLRRLVDLTLEQAEAEERAPSVSAALASLEAGGHMDVLRKGVMEEHYRETQEMIQAILLDGVSRGTFRPRVRDDAETIATNIHLYIDGLSQHYRYMTAERAKLKKRARYFIEGYIENLRIPGDRARTAGGKGGKP